jgi:O-antigen/teichoic acid export membrane protein
MSQIKYLISIVHKQFFGSQLRRNMSSGVIGMSINMLALFISIPLYLHFLDYERYGLWLILASVLSFAQLGMLGIYQAVMKLVAEEYTHGNTEGIQSYIAMSLGILAITGTTVLLVILVFKTQIISIFKLNTENTGIASWLLPYIGILTIYVFFVQVFSATLSGLGRMDLSNYIQSVGRVIAVGLSGGLLWSGRGVESILIGNTVSYIFIHIVALFYIYRRVPIRVLRILNFDNQRLKNLLSFGGGVFGASLFGILLDPFNKMMISRYAGVESIPVYDIAFRGSMQVRGITETSIRAIMPEISRVSVKLDSKGVERIKHINHRSLKMIIFGGMPLFLGLFIFAGVILKLWLGDRFVEPLPHAFRIMLIASFFSLLGVPSFYTLMGLGKVRHIFAGRGIVSVTSGLILVTTVLVSSALEISTVVWAAMAGMALSTLYLIWQRRLALTRYELDLV